MKTLKQKIEVMTAADCGQPIEWLCPSEPNDRWERCHVANNANYAWDWSMFDYRIAQPAIAPGHNPDKLTIDQVETHLGWRLLDRDEIKWSRSHEARRGNHIEMWLSHNAFWDQHANGACPDYCYRTKLTRDQLAALDNPPKQRIPLGPEDFPPGTVLRYKNRNHMWQAVTAVNSSGVRGAIDWEDFTTIINEERSLDGGKTWLPCYKTTE